MLPEAAQAPGTKPGRQKRLVRLFIVGMLVLHALFFVYLRDRILHGYPDFTVFYTGGTILREGLGKQLYDPRVQFQVQQQFIGEIGSRVGPLPYIHPPFEALVFLPLTLLPYHQAFLLWDLLNGIALFGVALILRRHLDSLREIPPWEFVLGFLAFFPIFATFLQGQDSILLLLLCALGFNALKRNADFLAGGWFALGMFKFQLVIPLVLLLVLWRRKRVGAGFAVVTAALALISLTLVGWDGALQYPRYVFQIARATSSGGVPSELMPNLRGLIEGWAIIDSSGIALGLVLAATIAIIAWAALKGSASPARSLNLQFSLAVVVTGLVSWHTNAHDLSLLILPLVLLADYSWSSLAQMPARQRALLLPITPILISPLWIWLWLHSSKVNLMAIPLLWWAWAIGREIARQSYSESVS